MSSPPSSSSSLSTVLVVGGCGFVGHHIVKRLLDRKDGTNVAVMNRNTSRRRLPGVEYYSGDITSEASVQDIVDKGASLKAQYTSQICYIFACKACFFKTIVHLYAFFSFSFFFFFLYRDL